MEKEEFVLSQFSIQFHVDLVQCHAETMQSMREWKEGKRFVLYSNCIVSDPRIFFYCKLHFMPRYCLL